MPATVYRPLKIMTFNANCIGSQAYEVRKLLQDLKIQMALLSETHLMSHMRLYVPKYEIYHTDHEVGHEIGTAVTLMKGIAHTCADLPPVPSVKQPVWSSKVSNLTGLKLLELFENDRLGVVSKPHF
jgi:hypothetical protein